mmetsp:Transcript_32997/g.94801  ORF Transcript_32997/g.94801 Transcript_32997/m.94801 type:complete len:237 (+) Transcript_32997:2885-3595(+)
MTEDGACGSLPPGETPTMTPAGFEAGVIVGTFSSISGWFRATSSIGRSTEVSPKMSAISCRRPSSKPNSPASRARLRRFASAFAGSSTIKSSMESSDISPGSPPFAPETAANKPLRGAPFACSPNNSASNLAASAGSSLLGRCAEGSPAAPDSAGRFVPCCTWLMSTPASARTAKSSSNNSSSPPRPPSELEESSPSPGEAPPASLPPAAAAGASSMNPARSCPSSSPASSSSPEG